ncbi:oligosaccharyl transferase stt3 subunit, partial [Aureobasidium sp. EXF-3399]
MHALFAPAPSDMVQDLMSTVSVDAIYYKVESFERPYKISPDEGDPAEDPLSNIHVHPFIYAGLFEPSGVSHADYGFESEQAFQYNEEFVQRRVAESEFAEPWTGMSSSMVFSTTSTLSQTIVAEQSGHVNVQVDGTDSGYASLNCQPLVCLQCGKTFKNKAEEKKHSSTHSRPFKCRIKNCTNTKGFATSNDLERHQKDIHLIKPKHGPQSYYRCVLPICSKREKIWSRKDNFKAHISRMHKHIAMDIDQLVARSEMTPTPAEMEHLARAKHAQAQNRSKGKQRTNEQPRQSSTAQCTKARLQVETAQAAIPLWQTNMPGYLDDMPSEAAEMGRMRVANTLVPNTANMAASVGSSFFKGETGRNTRGLLRLIILVTIAATAVASRLFSVIRFESIIHEFDPWFNFRATKYLVQNGFSSFWDWFDDRTWHPLGRVTGGTLYPGLMVTSGAIYHFLRLLTFPVDIRNICVMLAPACSGLTAFASYLLTSEMSDSPSAGLLAAIFMGIAPGYISRSVAGSYDNEAIAIFLLVFTFYLWIKSVKEGSVMWGAFTALFYGYMVSAWGGYVFITNLLPLHVFVLLCMGRYSPRLYVSYTTWYSLGTLASMQIPFVGFLPIRNSDHMAALGVFGLLQLVGFVEFVRQTLPSKQFQTLLRAFILVVFLAAFGVLVLLTFSGVVAPWSGRFYSLWDTGYAKIHIPIIASVSEHQPTAWPAFFFDLNLLIWLFPAGVYMCFRNLKDEQVFVVIYAVLASYFAGVMVRLMLTLTPVVCVAAALALSQILDTFLVTKTPVTPPAQANDSTDAPKTAAALIPDALRSTQKPLVGIYSTFSKFAMTGTITAYLLLFVLHCTWVTSNAYSSPSVVLASKMADGSQHIIDDYREAYYWLRQNTEQNAKIMSWWDYGYQIGGMADRPTLVDNNTWNNTHIATVGKAMSSREEVSYPIMRQHEVDYVLVVFGGLIGYSGDDINKFLWMVRIAEGIWPDEIKERDYFTARGEYRIDDQASETMKNSLMYKMSYYNYNSLFPAGQATDRVRGSKLPAEGPELSTLEEAFTSENWIIRIYKVKDLDNLNRDHQSAMAFEKGNKRKKTSKRKGPRVLRVE